MIFKNLILLLIFSFALEVIAVEELDKLQIKSLLEREQIIKTHRPVSKSGPWPEVQVWIYINASPIESTAIYYALDYQKEYIPNLIKSTPVAQPTPLETHTEYEYEMIWPIPNGKYINGSKLQKIDKNSYKVNWWSIKNNTAKETTGSAYFYPYQEGTILHYKSYVHPNSMFAGLLKNRMISSVQESLSAIRIEIERLKSINSPVLSKYIKKINNATQGILTYRNIK